MTGDANENQTILTCQSYIEKADLLVKALNHLFHIFRFSVCYRQYDALEVNALLQDFQIRVIPFKYVREGQKIRIEK